ncbi:hypothetical protein EHF33_02030 [Deinococcus psychrotolerans]|uniref:Uncharacterized protein n=1 Tax=Deinococcus psychrotolerans TaxID=2489213 RepID=A0A3G8Y8I0_9DEIO|nr:hypothetical protein [Deinococcus psychrotolerans]AZI41678.1 hypothetical protein EHF33_02030 [Deinococcus psychrotolerans]
MTAPPLSFSADLARHSLLTRGERIRTTLGVLIGLYILIGVLSLGILGIFWGFSGPFWKELQPDPDGLKSFVNWILGGSVLVSAAFFVLYVLALLAARRAIASVQTYALSGQTGSAARDARRFNKWLSAWQWWTLISAVLSVSLAPFFIGWAAKLDPATTQTLGSAELSVVAISGVLQALPTVVLTWLVLASIKRFFAAVALHAGGSRQPVTPVASAAGGWLIFTIVVLALGLAALAFFTLLVATLGTLPTMFAQDASFGVDPAAFKSAFGGVAVLLLLSAVLYGFLIALTAWSRGFALNAAALLDAARLGGERSAASLPMNEGTNPWKTSITLSKSDDWNGR